MSRVRRLRHRAGNAASAHERARRLAAERLDSRLLAVDADWLSDHLRGCLACSQVAAGYDEDRSALRALRGHEPEPPRDLWARTSAAIEREAGRPRKSAARPSRSRSGRRPALGVLSGVAVIAVVIGASLLSNGFLSRPPVIAEVPPSLPPVAAGASNPAPGATPIAVGAGAVDWIGTAANGSLAYNVTDVDEVCPVDRQPDCAPVGGQEAKPVRMEVRPKSVSRSPVRNQAVVVGTDKAGSDAVVVIALPTAEPDASPAPATPKPAVTPAPTPTTESTPVASPPEASGSPDGSPPATTPEPTPDETPVPTAIATVEPTATPTITPEPTVAASLAIASGVRVVGGSAAYSDDGDWFAFTARPSDDSAGPDIYVWRVGDRRARVLTNDHASVFASWAGDRVVGSRPAATAGDTTEQAATSFLVDPATGRQTDLSGTAWRPVVDPTGSWALTWDGTVTVGSDGLTIAPASGVLALRPYSSSGIDTRPTAGSVVTDDPVVAFDARWDETGRWLAIGLADGSDPAVGRLSLLHLDPASGRLERPHGAPREVTALAGFSIGDGRLAWATPPGQGGEGSRVQIVAWTNDGVGAVESGPIENVIVIH